jgi:AbrB family looped-hinge helix DNA binding protein
MRVTSKGQVTIPIDIRNKLGIQPNTEVRRPNRGEAIVTRLRRSARGATGSTMTTDELMALTRAE